MVIKMGKIKTHKASAKRFSVTGGGKVKMNHANRRHKLCLKTPKRKRGLRRDAYLSESFAPAIKTLIGK
jgi:large subunit ribosomal protein L35